MAVGLDKVKPENIKEDKSLVVEGMDISGHWNRMFEQRILRDYDVDLLEKVAELPGGEIADPITVQRHRRGAGGGNHGDPLAL